MEAKITKTKESLVADIEISYKDYYHGIKTIGFKYLNNTPDKMDFAYINDSFEYDLIQVGDKYHITADIFIVDEETIKNRLFRKPKIIKQHSRDVICRSMKKIVDLSAIKIIAQTKDILYKKKTRHLIKCDIWYLWHLKQYGAIQSWEPWETRKMEKAERLVEMIRTHGKPFEANDSYDWRQYKK